MNIMIILVTGSCGFIGSHVCETLLLTYPNYKIIGIDCISTFVYGFEQKIENRNLLCKYSNYKHIEDDIMNHNYIVDIKPDAIIHLAGHGNIGKSTTYPNNYIHNNVNVTTKLLHEMKCLKKMPLFLYASSSSVYGSNYKLPFSEEDPLDNIISVYGLSKKMCEDTVNLYCKMYGCKAIGFRFFTVYGPRGRPDMAIHKFLKSLIEGKDINIYGDGTTQRDYTYIDDIVQGILNSLSFIHCQNGMHKIYNLGCNKPIKLIDLINKCENITGKKTNIIIKPIVNEDLKITFANITKAKNELNYNPLTNIDIGLFKTYQWLMKTRYNDEINDDRMVIDVKDYLSYNIMDMSV